jgi:hypothetical protein
LFADVIVPSACDVKSRNGRGRSNRVESARGRELFDLQGSIQPPSISPEDGDCLKQPVTCCIVPGPTLILACLFGPSLAVIGIAGV